MHTSLAKLTWAESLGCQPDMQAAAIAGNFAVMRSLYRRGHQWNETTALVAAGSGNLEALQQLRAMGCPWDHKTTMQAAAFGHHVDQIWHSW